MTRSRDRDDIYSVAGQFVDSALRRDDSLFTPGAPIWSLAVLEDLHRRFVERPDDSSDSFEAKLSRQLADAPPATIQLMAEIVYVSFPDSLAARSSIGVLPEPLDAG